jgi:hypothetical protein
MQSFLHQRAVLYLAAHHFQEANLPDMYTVEWQKLKEYLAHKKVAVIFDEMSDDERRFVLNILFAPFIRNKEGKIVSCLGETTFLSKTDPQTVSQAVMKMLQLYGMDFCDMIVFDTHNAAYMKN